MSISRILGYIVAAALLILGLLFAWASSVQETAARLGVALISVAAALAIIYFLQRSKPTEIVQKLEVSGAMKAQEIRCPNCSAVLTMDLAKVVDGIPTIKCPYCGNSFEVTENPKW